MELYRQHEPGVSENQNKTRSPSRAHGRDYSRASRFSDMMFDEATQFSDSEGAADTVPSSMCCCYLDAAIFKVFSSSDCFYDHTRFLSQKERAYSMKRFTPATWSSPKYQRRPFHHRLGSKWRRGPIFLFELDKPRNLTD